MKLITIAAVGQNNELGQNNDLIWRFPEDMKFFKDTTWGHKVISGRKTFESLPGLLKGRSHIVLTRKALELPKEVEVYHSPDEFLQAYINTDEEIFNIGGATIYEELLEYTDQLYLTEIEAEASADVYFPNFDKNDFTKEVLAKHENNGIKFNHVLYKRR